jgi:hypothetical protein
MMPAYTDNLVNTIVRSHSKGGGMSDGDFLISYVQDCASGKVAFNDCGAVWQFGVIVFLLVAAILLLLALSTPAKLDAAKS